MPTKSEVRSRIIFIFIHFRELIGERLFKISMWRKAYKICLECRFQGTRHKDCFSASLVKGCRDSNEGKLGPTLSSSSSLLEVQDLSSHSLIYT